MKFILLMSALVLVWFVVRTIKQGEAIRQLHERRAASQGTPRRAVPATDTVACPRCGVYVPANHATACQRPDCPFPRR